MRTHAANASTPTPWLPGALQRKCSSCGSTSTASPCKTCSEESHDDHAAVPLQRRSTNAVPAATSAPASVRRTLAEPGQSLQPVLRRQMEQRFGQDFSQVRVHADAGAAASAADVAAQAYTVGRHVVFGQGRFQPHSREGRGLLAHELTHVVQQRSATPGLLRYAPNQNNDAPAEREAEHNAARVHQPGRLDVNVRVHGAATLHRRTLKEEPASGCGYCHGNAALAGTRAHQELQREWVLPYLLQLVGVPKLAEVPLTCKGKRKRPDLVLRRSADEWQIGSIKPARARYYADGRNVFLTYARCIKAAYPGARVLPLRVPLPKDVFRMPFPNPTATGCRPQYLSVNEPDEFGVYGYYCSPTRREELLRNPACKCKPKKARKKKNKQQKKQAKASKKTGSKNTKAKTPKPKTPKPRTPKPKSAGGAYNIGFGLSLFSLGGGAGNAGLGISIFSTSTGFGTAGVGISIASDSIGIGTAGAGATIASDNAGALALGGGATVKSQNAGAIVAGGGVVSDSSNSAIVAGGLGEMDNTEASGAVVAGKGTIRNSTISGSKASGSGAMDGVDGEASGATPAPVDDSDVSGDKKSDSTAASDSGTSTPAKPVGSDGTTASGDTRTATSGDAAAAAARGQLKSQIEAQLAQLAPESSPQERTRIAEEALRLRDLLKAASPAQQELLRRLAEQRAGYYPISAADSADRLLKATAGLTDEELHYLMGLDWQPSTLNPEELQERIAALLKSRRAASTASSATKPAATASATATAASGGGTAQDTAATDAKKGKGEEGSSGGDKRGDGGKANATGTATASTGSSDSGSAAAAGFTPEREFTGDMPSNPMPFGFDLQNAPVTAATQVGDTVMLVVTFEGSDKKTHRHPVQFRVAERRETPNHIVFQMTATTTKVLDISPKGKSEEFLVAPGMSGQFPVRR